MDTTGKPHLSRVHSRLAGVRRSRGVGASELAGRVGVSRQTIYAIEAGSYIPNTEVALRLSRELEVSVEELFSLETQESPVPASLPSAVLSEIPLAKGQPMRVCQVGERWVGIPVSAAPCYMPEADGVVARASRTPGRADLMVFSKADLSQKRLVLAGCDPAAGLLARIVEKVSGVEVVSAGASSKLALAWLKEGTVHIAGSHLHDPATGEFNLPFLRREFPDGDFRVITYAWWEEGLVLAKGNPKRIHGVEDLIRKNVRFVNRERGAGARALVDRLLAGAGLSSASVRGYEDVAYGHLPVAYRVLTERADCSIATRSAANAFGLDFIPLHRERYDLVMRKETAAQPAVEAFLDVLQRATLRRKLEVLGGYDTSQTGTILA